MHLLLAQAASALAVIRRPVSRPASQQPPRWTDKTGRFAGVVRNLSVAASRATILLRANLFVVLLLGATLFSRILWAAIIPLWQTPDEPAHYGYVQNFGEQLDITPDPHFSREILALSELTTVGGVPFNADNTQDFDAGSLDGPNEDQVKDLPHELRSEADISKTAAADYPPGYYLAASLVYRLLSGFDSLTIFFGVRMLSVLLATGTVLLSFLTLRLFFRDEMVARAASLIIAFSPMYIFAGMSVNPDVLVWFVFSIVLWLLTRSLDQGKISFQTGMAIALTIGAGLWVKQTVLLLIPFYFTLLGFLYLKGNLSLREMVRHGVMFSLIVALIGGWVFLGGLVRTSPEYPGGVNEPRSIEGFINHFGDRWIYYRWTFDTFWGNFGWLDTPIDTDTYEIIRLGSAVAALGLVGHIVMTTYRRTPDTKALYYLAITAVFMAFFVILNYFRITSGEGWLLQGRYFFPIMVPIVALLVRGLLWYVTEPARQRVVLLVLVAGMIWFQADALLRFVLPRYYL